MINGTIRNGCQLPILQHESILMFCNRPYSIVRQNAVHTNRAKPALLIVRKNSTTRHENLVFLIGDMSNVLFELFELSGAHLEPTALGKRFGAVLTTYNRRIDITRSDRLRDLCKVLKIKKVIITRTSPF